MNVVRNVCGVYRIPLLEVSTKAMLSNTTPVSAYRGAGRREANYYMGRLCDEAARELGMDRFEIRRRNPLKPSEIPYKNAAAMTVDSGDFGTIFEKALKAGDVAGFPRRKEESKASGRLRGLGVGSYMEVTAPPNKEMGGIRFENQGGVTLVSGTLDYGQGHAAPFAQVLVSRLGVPFGSVRLVQGDSDELVIGAGTGGSRSAVMGGGAGSGAARTGGGKGADRLVHAVRSLGPRGDGDGGRLGARARARDGQLARRQGLRRGGLRRRADLGDERDRRCAKAARHPSLRHAGERAAGVAGDPKSLVRVVVLLLLLPDPLDLLPVFLLLRVHRGGVVARDPGGLLE